MLLPLQNAKRCVPQYTQGDALGWVLLALQAVRDVFSDNHILKSFSFFIFIINP
jgi:hypothetical protein